MRYSETGFQLEVDLSKGSIDKVETDPRDTEQYLGGLGMNLKLLFERVPAGTDPWSPDNLLIFGNGLFKRHMRNRAQTVPLWIRLLRLNGFLGHSLMGGFFGAEMKMAGYDRIIIKGESPELVYLAIHDDDVEIRDARHLRGKLMDENAGR